MASLVVVVSAVMVLSCGQTNRRTHTDVDECFNPTTVTGISKYKKNYKTLLDLVYADNLNSKTEDLLVHQLSI